MLDQIFQNPAIKNLAFGQLKKIFAEHDISAIIVRLDSDGEIDAEFIKGNVHIIDDIDMNKYKEAYIKQLTQ